MPSSKKSSQRTRKMYELYTTGATLQEVATRFGLTRERVRQIFRKANLATRSLSETHTLRHNRVVTQRSEEICTAFSKYKGIDRVARELDLPRATVSEVVQSNCPPPRRRRRPRPIGPKYPTEELLARLQEAGTAVAGTLTVGAYSRYADARRTNDGRSWPSTHTYVKRFGSWRRALRRAGLPVNPRPPLPSRRRFSDHDCIQALHEVAQTLERVPTIAAYNALARSSHGRLPSSMTITGRLGTWDKALTKAGL